MAKKRFVILRKQMRDFYGKGWESKVIGIKGDNILVEAEVLEENGDMNAFRMEETINGPGEC